MINSASPTIASSAIRACDGLTGIMVNGGSPQISNSSVSGMKVRGVYVLNSASPTLTGNTLENDVVGIEIVGGGSGTYSGTVFSGNSAYAISYSGSGIIDATSNNWGHASGPLDDSDDRASGGLYNPGGLGNRVSDRVNYYPWTGCAIAAVAVPTGLAGQSRNGAIHLTWDAPAEAAPSGYKVYYGTTSGQYGVPRSVPAGTSYDLDGLANSTVYFIAVSAVNSLGAESSKSAEISLMPDGTLPGGTVQINGGAAFTISTTVTLTLGASDPSGVAEVCLSNTSVCTAWVPFATSKTWTINGGEGNRTVFAWFKDGAGNISASAATDDILVDTVVPETWIDSGPQAPTPSSTAIFSFSSPDEASPTFECSLDGAAFGACASPRQYTGVSIQRHTFAVRAVDPHGNRDATPATRTWRVGMNRAPELAVIGNKATTEAAALTFVVAATDGDGDPITLSASNLPLGARFDGATGNFSWTPWYDQAGTYTAVRFEATDGALTDFEVITVVVGDTPVTLRDGLVAFYPFDGDVQDKSGLANDGVNHGADFVQGREGLGLEFANGDYVEVPHHSSLSPQEAVSISLWAKVYSASQPYAALVYKAGENPPGADNHDRVYTLWATNAPGVHITSTPEAGAQAWCETSGGRYQLNKFVHIVGVIDARTHRMRIWVDGELAASQTYPGDRIRGGAFPLRIGGAFPTPDNLPGVNGVIDEVRIYNRPLTQEEISLLAHNRPPVLETIGDRVVVKGRELRFQVNATDPDGDAVSLTATNLPTGAAFDGPTRTFHWTPGLDRVGSYPGVRFEASDGLLRSFQEITITVTDFNQAPIALDDEVTTLEDTPIDIPVLANDSDPEGDPLQIVDPPLGCIPVPGVPCDRISYTPPLNFCGVTTFPYMISDGELPAMAQVTVNVTCVNDAPVLGPIGDKAVDEDQVLTFTVSGSDVESDDVVTLSVQNSPAGSSFDPASGVFTWKPGFNQQGNYFVTFTATDGGTPRLTDSETITITVRNVNRPPVLARPLTIPAVGEGLRLEFRVLANDPDAGDTLTFAVTPKPGTGDVDRTTGVFIWNTLIGDEGSYPVTFMVTDQDGAADSATATVVVGHTNQPPYFSPALEDQAALEGQPATFAVAGADADVADSVTVSMVSGPEGSAFDQTTGQFSWTPRYDQSGEHQAIFRVSDDGSPMEFSEGVVALSVASSEGPIFLDTFADGTAAGDPDWSVVTGAWTVVTGAYTSSKSFAGQALVKVFDPLTNPIKAGIIQASVKMTSTFRTAANGSIVFGYRDPTHYRYVRVYSGKIVIGQVGAIGADAAGIKKTIKTTTAVGRASQLLLKICPDGTVQVFKGTALKGSAKFAVAVPGGVGLAADRAKTIFDNVQVDDDSALSP
jgi:parallel beta-helix repeat protein